MHGGGGFSIRTMTKPVQRIVQRHGGEITFTSEPGHTAFSVRLPVTPDV